MRVNRWLNIGTIILYYTIFTIRIFTFCCCGLPPVEQLIHCTPVVPGFSARWPAEKQGSANGSRSSQEGGQLATGGGSAGDRRGVSWRQEGGQLAK